ncbi:uncharacterized protein LOC111346691 [Stylophora pistillata]|uniref:uncharacterized protein LOC111346691 n=1 Tax=Stylophora pistillata TaxID=50429 RepID=UPI000C04D41B|nr:uncharacterized protein LOC111346691 [Stylophora pistillata]
MVSSGLIKQTVSTTTKPTTMMVSTSSTSQPPTTPSKESSQKFEGIGKVEEPWESRYGDNKSNKYKELKGKLEKHLRGILEEKYEQNLLYIEVKNFRKGSIIFDFTVFLTSTTDVDANSLKEAIEKGEGGSENFTISVETVKQVAGPTQTITCPTCPEPGSCMPWIMVVIALGIIILLLLALLLFFILQNRRSKNSSKKWNTSDRQNYNDSFAQPRMYSFVSADMYPLTGTPRVARKTSSLGLTVSYLFSQLPVLIKLTILLFAQPKEFSRMINFPFRDLI